MYIENGDEKICSEFDVTTEFVNLIRRKYGTDSVLVSSWNAYKTRLLNRTIFNSMTFLCGMRFYTQIAALNIEKLISFFLGGNADNWLFPQFSQSVISATRHKCLSFKLPLILRLSGHSSWLCKLLKHDTALTWHGDSFIYIFYFFFFSFSFGYRGWHRVVYMVVVFQVF